MVIPTRWDSSVRLIFRRASITSMLNTGKARAVRVDTLNKLCRALNCQPGDLLEYRPGPEDDNVPE